MNKYFIKVILKNKFTKLLFLAICFICVVVTLQMREETFNYNVDDYIFQYKSRIIDSQVNLRRERYFFKLNGDWMGTVEGNFAWIQYLTWKLKTEQELLEELQTEGKVTDDFLQKQTRLTIIQNLCEIQASISVPNGDTPIEVACADELERYSDFLKLDELPFEFERLAYCGQGGLDASLSEANHNFILEAKVEFDRIENNTVEYGKASPWLFLSMLFGDSSLTSILITISVLLFSLGIITRWKEEGTYRNRININYTDAKMYRTYIKDIALVFGTICVTILLLFLIAWGFVGGFSGLASQVMCDSENFNTFSKFTHDEGFSRIGIAKVFYDFVDPYWQFTIHEYSLIDFRVFLLAAGVLSILKIFFFILLGTGIGFVFSDKSKSIVAGIIISILALAGQTKLESSFWNPFAVKSCWNITLGGAGITWFNAVILLLVWDIVLYFLFMIIISKKEME